MLDVHTVGAPRSEGRYVAPHVDTGSAESSCRPGTQLSVANAPVVLYIAGSGRSGSTLVERTIGGAPNFTNVGELIDLFRRVGPNDERCGCGRLFSRCEFWTEVGDRAFGGWRPATLARMRELQLDVARQRHIPSLVGGRRRAFDERVRRYAELHAAVYRAVAETAGVDHVVDATKWPAQALALLRGGLDLRVLHLCRDPRGVAFSQSKAGVARPHDVRGRDQMSSIGSVRAVARWGLTQNEVGLVRRLGAPVTTLDYEDFVRQPAESLSVALGDLGLRPGPGAMSHVDGGVVTLSPSHGLSGNPSRFASGAIRLRADEQWRTEMPRRERLVVSALSAPVRAVHRRPPRPGRAPVPLVHIGQWPTVSVVMPTHGRPELVRASIRAVLDQDYAGDLECLVVHDREDVDVSLSLLGGPGREVAAVRNTRTPGLPGARNTGVALARGALVASCDDDDVWYPEKLRVQVARLLSEPDLLVVGAGISLVLPEGVRRDRPGRARRVDRALLLRNRVKELHSSTLLMHKDAFAKAGGYDETLPHGFAEDHDWILRAARVGRIGIVAEPLAAISKDQQSYYTGRAERTVEGLLAFLERHPAIEGTRRGHARVLGQIAFNQAAAGRRGEAIRTSGRALARWPFSPHAATALATAAADIDPDRVRSAVRRLTGRGLA